MTMLISAARWPRFRHGSDEEFTAAGFGINDAEAGDTDLDAFDSAAAEAGADDDFVGEDNYGDGDFDE